MSWKYTLKVSLVNSRKVTIIGGGIVGLATAYRLGERFPGARITVLEKETEVGRHQTGHNSGVLHSGLYYKPGSARARLAVAGIRQMVEFCQENGIPHEICGKLVVAAEEGEVPRLRGLEERGAANGLEGLRWLGRGEMREIEPHAAGIRGLHVPETGIVDFAAVTETYAKIVRQLGGEIRLGTRVLAVRHRAPDWIIEILSPSTVPKDLIQKLALYERVKVKEYWVVDPVNRIVSVYVFNDRGSYGKPVISAGDSIVKVGVLPGFEIDFKSVFR